MSSGEEGPKRRSARWLAVGGVFGGLLGGLAGIYIVLVVTTMDELDRVDAIAQEVRPEFSDGACSPLVETRVQIWHRRVEIVPTGVSGFRNVSSAEIMNRIYDEMDEEGLPRGLVHRPSRFSVIMCDYSG